MRTPFDLILMDLLMPGMDGFAALAALRQAGSDAFLTKPSANAEITDVANRFLFAGSGDARAG